MLEGTLLPAKVDLVIQYCKREHSSCAAFSVFYEYFAKHLSAFSAVIRTYTPFRPYSAGAD